MFSYNILNFEKRQRDSVNEKGNNERDELFVKCYLKKRKERLGARNFLSKHTLYTLQEKLFKKGIYHSNANEGNTLTINEKSSSLERGTVGEETLREHFWK